MEGLLYDDVIQASKDHPCTRASCIGCSIYMKHPDIASRMRAGASALIFSGSIHSTMKSALYLDGGLWMLMDVDFFELHRHMASLCEGSNFYKIDLRD